MSLIFKYGCMNAAKTMQLLAFRHSLVEMGIPVVLVKPAVDTRYPHPIVGSRSGLQANADLLVYEDSIYDPLDTLLGSASPGKFVLVDEAQFLFPDLVWELRSLVDNTGCTVICYGLKSDSKANLFPASAELFLLSDQVEYIESYCTKCKVNKAIFNARIENGYITKDGPQIAIEGEYTYTSVCSKCFI